MEDRKFKQGPPFKLLCQEYVGHLLSKMLPYHPSKGPIHSTCFFPLPSKYPSLYSPHPFFPNLQVPLPVLASQCTCCNMVALLCQRTWVWESSQGVLQPVSLPYAGSAVCTWFVTEVCQGSNQLSFRVALYGIYIWAVKSEGLKMMDRGCKSAGKLNVPSFDPCY